MPLRPTLSKPTVLVVGDVAHDTVVRLTNTVAVAGADTASIIVDEYGGQGANTARWLSTTDVNVQLLASVSASEDLDRLHRHFHSFGILPMLNVVDAPPARVISVLNADGADRSFFTQRGAAAELTPIDLDHLDLGLVDWIHVSGYLLTNSVGQACYARLRQMAAERHIPLSLDPASLSVVHALGVAKWKTLVESVDLMVPNADEARLLTGQPDLVQACIELRAIAARVVVTHAHHGAHYCDASISGHEPGLAVEHPIDPTGAGDAFAAGLIASLANGNALAQAVVIANEFGALCVTRMGAVPPQPGD